MMTTLLDAALRALVIASLVGLALKAWRVRSGAIRHAAWAAVVVSMLALPLLPGWIPTFALPFPAGALTPTGTTMGPLDDTVESTPTAGGGANVPASMSRAAEVPGPTASTSIAPSAQSGPSQSWTSFAAALWLAGLLLLLVRMFAGWRRAARLATGARPVTDHATAHASSAPFYESPCVGAPISVGVWRPRIVLPMEWRTWTPETQHVVLMHEGAHLARRDAMVSLIAALNTCVFWFHPLAWWLQRQVAESAEQACDDRVVRETRSGADYADVLVQMAHAVQLRGTRITWAGLGIGGDGRLAARIDRALRGDSLRQTSRLARVTLTLTCAAAIVVGVACRQQVAPLKPDPSFQDQDQDYAERERRWKAARDLSLDQLATLEQKVSANPDDLDTTQTLLWFYQFSGQKVLGWERMLAGRLPHILRVIERHPDSDLVAWPVIVAQYDPAGYRQARDRWMTAVNAPDVKARTLGNAAAFFAVSEKDVAEALLLRAERLEPGGPTLRVVNRVAYLSWTTRLGELYAQALVGANDNMLGRVVNSVSTEEARRPFAVKAHQILESTSDVELLTAAGRFLIYNVRGASGRPDVDSRAVGVAYLNRALEIDPHAAQARRILDWQESVSRDNRLYEQAGIRGAFEEIDDTKIAALTDADRLWLLPNIAGSAFSRAERMETTSRAEFNRWLDRSEQTATAALEVCERLPDDPRRGEALYRAHLTRALVAIRRGDTQLSVRELQRAVDTPASSSLNSLQIAAHHRVVNYLLKNGERASVIAFLEKGATLMPLEREQMLKDAAAIRNGIMPRSYQAMFARTPGA